MAAWCDEFMKVQQTEAAPIYTKEEAKKFLALVGDAAISKQWVADPEAAMHLTWAYVTLSQFMRNGVQTTEEMLKWEMNDPAMPKLRRGDPDARSAPRARTARGGILRREGRPHDRRRDAPAALDLFNKFNAKDFTPAFKGVMDPPPK